MKYQDFLIRIGPKIGSSYQVRVTTPGGEANGRFSPPDPIAEVRRSMPGLWRDLGLLYPKLENLEVYGRQLYEALFQGEIRRLLDYSLGAIYSSDGQGILIKIQIETDSMDALEAIPWEALFHPSTGSFLALSRSTPILRYWNISNARQQTLASEKLQILLVLSSPRGSPSLDLEQERQNIVAATANNHQVEVHILNNATIVSLREFLATHEIHVLHFMGSSAFDQTNGEGALVFENEKGQADLIPATQIAWLASSHPSLQIVFLNACDTARVLGRAPTNPFRGIATALVLSGLPAVLGMQFPISDTAAIAFSSIFYQRLAAGDPIEAAVTEGRFAIAVANDFIAEWVTPVLFTNAVSSTGLNKVDSNKLSNSRLRIFLCHATEDKPAIRDLYRRLQFDNFDVWLDEVDILPGKRWRDEIFRALRESDVILVCLSGKAIAKTGFLQKELTTALDLLDEQPEGTIFLIPARLEECKIPERLRDIQYVDLFQTDGYAKLIRALGERASGKA